MSGTPLYILLCSAEHEKIQMAAMLASVAAVSERPVTVFVSMGALPVFRRGAEPDEVYQGGAFSQVLRDKGTVKDTPEWVAKVGHEMVETVEHDGYWSVVVRKTK